MLERLERNGAIEAGIRKWHRRYATGFESEARANVFLGRAPHGILIDVEPSHRSGSPRHPGRSVTFATCCVEDVLAIDEMRRKQVTMPMLDPYLAGAVRQETLASEFDGCGHESGKAVVLRGQMRILA
jgi:hypothetical protein